MTRLQKLQVEQSEKRQRLNELLGKEELTAEERSTMETLTTRMQELEPEIRAAIVAEGEAEVRRAGEFADDPEGAELRALIEGASLADIFRATVEHRDPDGQCRELQSHLGLSGNQVPLALLRARRAQAPASEEHRAVTPAPSNVQGNQQPIIPDVFPASVAAWLGVDMPTVPVGQAVFPVLTTGASVKVPAKNAAATETTGAFSADKLSPGRLQASFFYAREDAAVFAGMDEALRSNLSESLSDALDKQIIVGADGLLTGTNLTNNGASGVTSYVSYRSDLAYGRVDGKYALNAAELKIVMGSGTYAHAASQFGTNGERAALEDLMASTGGVRVSAHVPAVASNKQEAIVRLGMRRDMVAPIWEGVSLIPDEVTLAGKGQVKITAVMLYAVKILRAAGFHKQETQHA